MLKEKPVPNAKRAEPPAQATPVQPAQSTSTSPTEPQNPEPASPKPTPPPAQTGPVSPGRRRTSHRKPPWARCSLANCAACRSAQTGDDCGQPNHRSRELEQRWLPTDKPAAA